MLIKLSEQLEEKNEEEENIYENIVPKDRKICRANSMFLSISECRRKQLEMNKFAGWDLVLRDSVDKVTELRLIVCSPFPIIFRTTTSGLKLLRKNWKRKSFINTMTAKRKAKETEMLLLLLMVKTC